MLHLFRQKIFFIKKIKNIFFFIFGGGSDGTKVNVEIVTLWWGDGGSDDGSGYGDSSVTVKVRIVVIVL